MKRAALILILAAANAVAQIPSGFVQTTATVPSLANGQFFASWTNLSSSPQLGLLGCVSTFQTTVNGTFDSNGHISTLLADVAQICPSPSTWTLTFTFECPTTSTVNGAFQVAVPVTGGGGTEDITTQITAALPTNPCGGGSVVPSKGIPGPVYNVADYGAIGNCTGSGSTVACTNNHNSIQAAIDAAYMTGGSVYFPTSLAASGQTVYYTATAVNPKGVSMFGPAGASGPGNFYTSTLSVAVRGAPGQDVFALVDASDPGYVTPRNSFAVRDLAILVDDTVDASASFPYRKPGRIFKDGVANGTAVITSADQALFTPGDVGQAITIGATTTTILSYQSAKQVTLNATVTTGTGLSGYVSVLGLPVSSTIGNCGWAYPDRAGAADLALVPDKSDFTNIVVQTIDNNAGVNNSCGFFFQGNQAPTWTRWQNVTIGAEWGMWFVPQNQATPNNTTQWPGSTDFNVLQNINMNSFYPLGAYSTSYWTISGMQIAAINAGPQILAAYSRETSSLDWDIDLRELEPNNACPSANTALRITGAGHIVRNLSVAMCAGHPGTIQWDADSSSMPYLFANNIAAVNITGNLNKIESPRSADLVTGSGTFSVTGRGNTYITGSMGNPFGGSQPGRNQYVGGVPGGFGSPLLSHGGITFDRRADFINNGASAYYFNNQDLWFWPNEMLQDSGGAFVPVADATSETGQYIPTVSGASRYINGTNGSDWIIGKQIPAGKFRVYAKIAVATSTSNATIYVQANTSGFTNIGGPCTTAGVGTTYQTVSCDADATGLEGDQFRLIVVSVTQAGKVAWVGIRPIPSELPTNSLQIGAGIPTTDNQGTGAKLQHSTGTTTTNNLAKFDVNGNTVDAGAPYTAATITTGTPTVGQAACIYAAGPPVVIGKCTSVVGAGGACTCAP